MWILPTLPPPSNRLQWISDGHDWMQIDPYLKCHALRFSSQKVEPASKQTWNGNLPRSYEEGTLRNFDFPMLKK